MEEIVRKQIDYLYKVKERLERQSLIRSKSTYLKNANDYDICIELLRQLGEEPVCEFLATHPDNRFFNPNCSLDREENKEIVKNMTSLLKKANYEVIEDYDVLNITKKDRHEIMFDYFDYAFPNGSKMLKEMFDKGKILSKPLDDCGGVTYPFNTFDDSYVFVNSEYKNQAIIQMDIIVHEMFHVYSANMTRNQQIYRDELDYGPYTEIASVYSEMSFLDWLKRNKIFPDYAEKYINNYIRGYFEFVRMYGIYLDNVKNRKSIEFDGNDYDIDIPTNVKPEEERASIFDITDFDYSGNIADFRYAIALQKMTELFEKEKSGEKVKNLVDDILFNLHMFDQGGLLVEPYYSKFFEDYLRKNTEKVRELNIKK